LAFSLAFFLRAGLGGGGLLADDRDDGGGRSAFVGAGRGPGLQHGVAMGRVVEHGQPHHLRARQGRLDQARGLDPVHPRHVDIHEHHVRLGPQALEHLQTVDLGQLEVQQDQLRQRRRGRAGVRAGAQQVIQRLHAIVGHDHVVLDVVLLQRAQREQLVVGIIFH